MDLSSCDGPQPSRILIIALVSLAIGIIAAVAVIGVYVLRLGIPQYVLDSLVYASLFGLMAIGLTLTYMTTKVPNFAYGSFVAIGIYASFTLYKLDGFSPYQSAPVGFLIGGISSMVMYVGVLRVLARRGSSLVSLMISTLAVDIAFIGIFGIYTDYLYYHYHLIDSKEFYQLGGDFTLLGTPGLVFAAPISLGVIAGSIFVLLTQTKFGIAMRASVENASLARVLGIDVEKTYLVSWFLAGGLAALAGTFYTLWFPGTVHSGSDLIVEIFSASVLGGLTNIYGAALGGLIIGASEILVTDAGARVFGSGIFIYQKGIPLVIMVITLLVIPRGLTSVDWRHLPRNLRLSLSKLARRVSRRR